MYNKVILVGNLTRDIEVRYTQSGSAIANTGIAVNKKWKSQSGEQKNEVMFVDITFFGRTAEIANQYLKRGSKVLVDGRLKFDQWVAQDGTKRNKHSVIGESMQMLDNKGDNVDGRNVDYREQFNQPNQNQQSNHQLTNNSDSYSNNQNSNYQQQHQPPAQNNQPQETPKIPEIDISEDEIPF